VLQRKAPLDLIQEQKTQSERSSDEEFSADPKAQLRKARQRNLRNPTYRIIIRDLEFAKNNEAFNDPNFNPERFFHQINEERARHKAIERRKLPVNSAPKSPTQKPTPVASMASGADIKKKILKKYPNIEE
jgi:hypothetical protein